MGAPIVVEYCSSPSESPTPEEASSKPAPTTDASLALPDDMTLVAAAPESDLIYFATPETPSREIWAYSAAEDRVVAVWASMDRSVLSLAHAGALLSLERDARGAAHVSRYAVASNGRVAADAQLLAGPVGADAPPPRGVVRAGGDRVLAAVGDDVAVYEAGGDALFEPRRRFRRGADAGAGDAVLDAALRGTTIVFATRAGAWTCAADGSTPAYRAAEADEADDAVAVAFLDDGRFAVARGLACDLFRVDGGGRPRRDASFALTARLASFVCARGAAAYAGTDRGVEVWRTDFLPRLDLVHAAPPAAARLRLALLASAEGRPGGRAWPLAPEPPAAPDDDAGSVDSFEETGLCPEPEGDGDGDVRDARSPLERHTAR